MLDQVTHAFVTGGIAMDLSGEAKVDQLELTVMGPHQVAGVEVAMNVAVLMAMG